MKKLFILLIVGLGLAFGSCDNDIVESEFLDDGLICHTTQLVFNGCIDHFDALTRAVTSEWDSGAKLYIKFVTASSIIDGIATYRKYADMWEVQYNGSITEGQTNYCEVYYFDNPQSASTTDVTLSAQSAVFSDNQASYLFEDGVVKLTAHLKPLTGRLRFRGTAGQQVSFSGLMWYSGYNITANKFSMKAAEMTLTVASDGYTPYVYATFESPSYPQLRVDSGDEYFTYLKTFDSSVLATGKSGYLDITSRDGWKLVERTKHVFTVTSNGKTVKFKMIKVEPGTFQMGNEEMDFLNPVHSVTLTNSYYMGETEVTQALWYAVMGQKPNWGDPYGLGDNFPAYLISYKDCQQFLKKLNQLTGRQFRFPTEAEWEFAAKGGTKSRGYTYAGSDEIGDVAWYSDNADDVGRANPNYGTHTVKTKQPNELGLYDMSGNVSEWCYDWWEHYPSSSQTNPTGPTSSSYRIKRGGGWGSGSFSCRPVDRSMDIPESAGLALGFRLAL